MPFRTAPKTEKSPEWDFVLITSQKENIMKKSACSIIGLSLTAVLLLLNANVFAQKTTVWKGGAPGMENDWNCPKNWNTYSVPDVFSNVIIPDVSTTTLAAPVIKNGRMEVNTLFLETNAFLTVEELGQLVIFEQVGSFYQDNLRVEGSVFIINERDGKNTKASTATNR